MICFQSEPGIRERPYPDGDLRALLCTKRLLVKSARKEGSDERAQSKTHAAIRFIVRSGFGNFRRHRGLGAFRKVTVASKFFITHSQRNVNFSHYDGNSYSKLIQPPTLPTSNR